MFPQLIISSILLMYGWQVSLDVYHDLKKWRHWTSEATEGVAAIAFLLFFVAMLYWGGFYH